MRRSKFAWQAAKFTGRTTEKAVVGLTRWATTDHTGSWNTARKQASRFARSSGRVSQRPGHRLECSADGKSW